MSAKSLIYALASASTCLLSYWSAETADLHDPSSAKHLWYIVNSIVLLVLWATSIVYAVDTINRKGQSNV